MAHFHNDERLQKIVLSILERCTVFVETGAYCGDSSKWIAEQRPDLPVYTCEINPVFYVHALARMPKNAQITNASSPVYLHALLDDNGDNPLFGMPFFFLDAHWYDYWPLRDELKIIGDNLSHAIILVHDFKVPGRDNFSYCNGGGGSPSFSGRTTEGGPVPDMDYIVDLLGDDFCALYPTYGGAHPGYVLIFQNIAPFGNLGHLGVGLESKSSR